MHLCTANGCRLISPYCNALYVWHNAMRHFLSPGICCAALKDSVPLTDEEAAMLRARNEAAWSAGSDNYCRTVSDKGGFVMVKQAAAAGPPPSPPARPGSHLARGGGGGGKGMACLFGTLAPVQPMPNISL